MPNNTHLKPGGALALCQYGTCPDAYIRTALMNEGADSYPSSPEASDISEHLSEWELSGVQIEGVDFEDLSPERGWVDHYPESE